MYGFFARFVRCYRLARQRESSGGILWAEIDEHSNPVSA